MFLISPEFYGHLSGVAVSPARKTVPSLRLDVILLHQPQNKNKMKTTTTLLLAAFFTLSFNSIFAKNTETNSNKHMATTSAATLSISFSTPREATFEEMPDATADFSSLAPVTPKEADFSDSIELNLTDLAPVTQAVADFEELR
jgi:hypothetical protein